MSNPPDFGKRSVLGSKAVGGSEKSRKWADLLLFMSVVESNMSSSSDKSCSKALSSKKSSSLKGAVVVELYSPLPSPGVKSEGMPGLYEVLSASLFWPRVIAFVAVQTVERVPILA